MPTMVMTPAALEKISIVKPTRAKGRWAPVAHAHYLRVVRSLLEGRNMKPGEWTINVSAEDVDGVPSPEMAATCTIKLTGEPLPLKSASYAIGLLSSNAQRFPRQIVLGVELCRSTNMETPLFLPFEFFQLGRSTETMVERLEEDVDNRLSEAIGCAHAVRQRMRELREWPIINEAANSVLIQLAEKRLLPWTSTAMTDKQTGIAGVRDAFLDPPHHEFLKNKAWTLWCAYAQSAWKRNPIKAMHWIATVGDMLLNTE